MPVHDPGARRHHPQAGELDLFLANRDIARMVSRDYFLPDGDEQDVLQECEIGLLVACRDYDGRTDFRPYAHSCVRSWIQMRVTAARRLKHRVLTEAGRVTRNEDDELVPILELLATGIDVEREVFGRERLERMRVLAAGLSPLERRAVSLFVNGLPYTHEKQMDNAMQRARRKLMEAA
jgi:RNA polymerase sporulation-specific sigma factor